VYPPLECGCKDQLWNVVPASKDKPCTSPLLTEGRPTALCGHCVWSRFLFVLCSPFSSLCLSVRPLWFRGHLGFIHYPAPRREGAGYCNRPVCYLTKSTILSSMLVGSVCEFVCVYVSLYRSHFESECHGTSPMDLLATRIEPYNFWHVKVKGQGQEKFLKIAKY